MFQSASVICSFIVDLFEIRKLELIDMDWLELVKFRANLPNWYSA